MSRPDGPMLVLGVGNVLLRDDGVGVQVVRALQGLEDHGEVELPPDTSLVDGGTLGHDLLPLLADARAVLLIDAVDLDRPPGAVEVIRGDALRSPRSAGIVTHRAGLDDLLDTARIAGTLPEAVALVGVRPSEIAVGLELSEVVRSAVPVAIEATIDELNRLDAIAPSGPAQIASADEAAEATP